MTERDERIVSDGLRVFAEVTRHREAPSELEDLLREQLARKRKSKSSLRSLWVACAAMLALGLFAGVRMWNRLQVTSSLPQSAAVLPQPTPPRPLVKPDERPEQVPASNAQNIQRVSTGTQARSNGFRARRATAQETAAIEQLTPWYVNSALPQVTRGRVLRVEVSPETAASFGVYVPRGAARADLLVGDDGLARAIRFIR